jgi:gamma-glutamylcyclotransferase (GGCT)/AIG2-like uncharacterized protein YtfP
METKIFVYGTLKRGFSNHDHYIPQGSHIEEAQIVGRLYDVGLGFPTLDIPESGILVKGSSDFAADMALAGLLILPPPAELIATPPFGLIQGEAITLANPLEAARRMDLLEGFSPPHRSMYQRVLVWIKAKKMALAWVYVNGEFDLATLKKIEASFWNEDY